MSQLTKSTRALVIQCVAFFVLMVALQAAGSWLFADVWLGPVGFPQILLSSALAAAIYAAIMFTLERLGRRRNSGTDRR